jgi:hypothetical protein
LDAGSASVIKQIEGLKTTFVMGNAPNNFLGLRQGRNIFHQKLIPEWHLLKRFRPKSDIKRCPESRIEQVVSSQKYESNVQNLTRDWNFQPL